MKLLDTTLRDGDQAIRENMYFGPESQADLFRRYALAASDFGMHFIEAGYPASGQQNQDLVQAIAVDHRTCPHTSIMAFARAHEKDINLARDSVKPAARNGIALLTSVSDFQMDKFRDRKGDSTLPSKRARLLELFRQSVEYAKSTGVTDLLVYLEDSTRADISYLLDLCHAYIEAGATIIDVPDTVGHTNCPAAYADLIQRLREETPGSKSVEWSAHLHNDRGLAVATALEVARRQLVEIIDGTINGEGERTGNLSLATYLLNTQVPGLATYPESAKMAGLTDEGLRTLESLSNLGSEVLNIPRSVYLPGHGLNAHRTAAGMHQDGTLKNPRMFQSYPPELIGVNVEVPFVYTHQSGSKGLKAILEAMGIGQDAKTLERTNEYAYQMSILLGGRVSDELLLAAAWEAELENHPETLPLKIDYGSIQINHQLAATSDTSNPVTVTGNLELRGQPQEFIGRGDGPTSAFVAGLNGALNEIDVKADVRGWTERAVIGASNEPGREATVYGFARMDLCGQETTGFGVDDNATIASFKACAQPINRWLSEANKSDRIAGQVLAAP